MHYMIFLFLQRFCRIFQIHPKPNNMQLQYCRLLFQNNDNNFPVQIVGPSGLKELCLI